MVTTQITRRKNADTSETLIKHIDGTTLPYSGANLTTMLSGVTNPIFVLKKIHSNGYAYPLTLHARNQKEFTTAAFETARNALLSNPDQPFGKLM
jgi:formylmethanofuran dehydrogenase subunit E-like metal-binding protein